MYSMFAVNVNGDSRYLCDLGQSVPSKLTVDRLIPDKKHEPTFYTVFMGACCHTTKITYDSTTLEIISKERVTGSQILG